MLVIGGQSLEGDLSFPPDSLLAVCIDFCFLSDSLTGGSTTDGRKLSLEGTSMEVERLRKGKLSIIKISIEDT